MSDVSQNLSHFVNFDSVMLVLDEKTLPFKGHAYCFRMHRGRPVVWTNLATLQCPGSIFAFPYAIWPNVSHSVPSRVDVVKWAHRHKCSLDTDSYYYLSPDVLRHFGEHDILFVSPVSLAWFRDEVRSLKSKVVDEGDAVVAVEKAPNAQSSRPTVRRQCARRDVCTCHAVCVFSSVGSPAALHALCSRCQQGYSPRWYAGINECMLAIIQGGLAPLCAHSADVIQLMPHQKGCECSECADNAKAMSLSELVALAPSAK